MTCTEAVADMEDTDVTVEDTAATTKVVTFVVDTDTEQGIAGSDEIKKRRETEKKVAEKGLGVGRMLYSKWETGGSLIVLKNQVSMQGFGDPFGDNSQNYLPNPSMSQNQFSQKKFMSL